MTDYLKYYNLEKYLLNDVRTNFQKNGYLTSFEFFCIVIWKANRAKSKIAKRLLKNGANIEDSVHQPTSQNLHLNHHSLSLPSKIHNKQRNYQLPNCPTDNQNENLNAKSKRN